VNLYCLIFYEVGDRCFVLYFCERDVIFDVGEKATSFFEWSVFSDHGVGRNVWWFIVLF